MRLKSNDPCWCGSGLKHKRCHGDRRALARDRVELGDVSPERPVPSGIERPDYVETGRVPTARATQIQTPESLDRLRHAGAVAAEVLLRAGRAVGVGVRTDELDEIAHDTYVEFGAYPSTLRYRG